MAYDPNELLVSVTETPMPKCAPAEGPGAVVPASMAGGTALLPVGTPLAYNTSTNLWVVADLDGTASNDEDEIRSFVYPNEHQLVTGAETICQTLRKGMIDYDDFLAIAIANTTATDATNFDPQMDKMAARGIHVNGWNGIRNTND